MANTLERFGVVAEIASAVAVVFYPLVRLFSHYAQQRRQRQLKAVLTVTGLVEARLAERCRAVERRLADLEQRLRGVA